MGVVSRLRETAARFAAFVAVMVGVPVGGRAYAAGDANRSSCSAVTEAWPGFRDSLPDCRAYEVVGESNSNDTSNVEGSYGFPEGLHVYYKSFLPTPAAGAGNGLPERFLATRTASGWMQQPISAPQGEGPSHLSLAAQENAEGVVFAKNFSEAFIGSMFRDPLEIPVLNQTTGAGVYKLSLANGAVAMLSLPDSGALTQEMLEGSGIYSALAEVNDWGSFMVGGAADGSKAFFETTAQLATAPGTPRDTHEASDEIYERTEGHTYLVGVLPNESAPVCGAEIAQGAGSTVGTTPFYSYGAVAPSGDNVVFRSPGREAIGAKEPCNEEGLFLRDVADGKTIQLPGTIFAGRAGTGPGEEEKIFTFGAGGLDEYHLGTNETTEIGKGVADALLAYTQDGARVFYLGPSEEIFVSDEGKQPTEIPKSNEGGYGAVVTGARGGGKILGGGSTEYAETNNMPVTTPSGSDLLFVDTAKLGETGYENCTEVEIGNRVCHHEAYVYDAKSDKVTCISCNPRNFNSSDELEPEPQGQAQLIDVFSMDSGELPYETPSPPLISNNGSRAVFETNEALVPQDVNGTDDVYEWEREGTEGCTIESAAYSSVNEGCIYMLSSGLGKEGVNTNGILAGAHLVGASENLEDVYIQTSESLLTGLDNASKLYDVRVDGGFPYTQSSRGCEQCAATGGKPAAIGASLTEAFVGAGNLSGGMARRGKPSSAAQKRRLARALRACRRGKKSRRRRAQCERTARRRYPVEKSGRSARAVGGR